MEQLQFCSPQALTELKAFDGGAAHVNCCMAKTRQPQSKPCSLRFRSCLSCSCSTTDTCIYLHIHIVFVFAYFFDSACNGGVIGNGPKSIQCKTVKWTKTKGGKNEKKYKRKVKSHSVEMEGTRATHVWGQPVCWIYTMWTHPDQEHAKSLLSVRQQKGLMLIVDDVRCDGT